MHIFSELLLSILLTCSFFAYFPLSVFFQENVLVESTEVDK